MQTKNYIFRHQVSFVAQSLDYPDPYQSFHCQITAEPRARGEREYAGKVTGYLLPEDDCDGNLIDLLYEADRDVDLWNYTAALVSGMTNDFREELELACGNGILAIHNVHLEPKFRGFNLGLVAVDQVIHAVGFGCKAVVMRPFPLGEAQGTMDVEQATAKLANHWGKIGFKPVPGYPDFLYRDLSYIRPKAPRIRSRRKPGRKVAA